jgi:hypothetical protein
VAKGTPVAAAQRGHALGEELAHAAAGEAHGAARRRGGRDERVPVGAELEGLAAVAELDLARRGREQLGQQLEQAARQVGHRALVEAREVETVQQRRHRARWPARPRVVARVQQVGGIGAVLPRALGLESPRGAEPSRRAVAIARLRREGAARLALVAPQPGVVVAALAEQPAGDAAQESGLAVVGGEGRGQAVDRVAQPRAQLAQPALGRAARRGRERAGHRARLAVLDAAPGTKSWLARNQAGTACAHG